MFLFREMQGMDTSASKTGSGIGGKHVCLPYMQRWRKTLICNGSRAHPRVGADSIRPRTFRFYDKKNNAQAVPFVSFRGTEGDVGIRTPGVRLSMMQGKRIAARSALAMTAGS